MGVATVLLCGTSLAELIKDHLPLGYPPQGNAPTGLGPAGGFESIYQSLTILDAALNVSCATRGRCSFLGVLGTPERISPTAETHGAENQLLWLLARPTYIHPP